MSLGKQVGLIGLHTTLGRFFGYLRDTVAIGVLGASAITDALFIAAKIASLFRRLFVEGAFNASFIPIFLSLKEKKGDKKATYFAEQSMIWMTLFIGTITIYVLGCTETFVGLIASGFKDDPEKFQWTVEFTKIIFPFVIIISLTAILGSVLNAVHNFVQTAANQTVGNLSIILLFFALQNIAETKAHALAWAILGSSLIQFMWLYVVALRLGIVILPRIPRLTSPVKEFMLRVLPGIFGAGMVQINVMISIFFGSYLEDGGISYLQITERVNQFPLSVISVLLGTVLIPMLTTQLQQHSMDKALDTQNKAIELSLALSLPICLIVSVFAAPIIAALFMYGKFSEANVLAASPCLIAFVSGLPAYVLLKVFSSTFFALKDTLRPSIVGCVSMGVNAVLCYLIVNDFILQDVPNHIGIAAALSISGWVNLIGLIGWSYMMGYFKLTLAFVQSLVRIAAIALIIGGISYFAYPLIHSLAFDYGVIHRWIALGSVISVASASYFIIDIYYKKIIGINQ
jgi:putative peptidoglycan lipid II flippase